MILNGGRASKIAFSSLGGEQKNNSEKVGNFESGWEL